MELHEIEFKGRQVSAWVEKKKRQGKHFEVSVLSRNECATSTLAPVPVFPLSLNSQARDCVNSLQDEDLEIEIDKIEYGRNFPACHVVLEAFLPNRDQWGNLIDVSKYWDGRKLLYPVKEDFVQEKLSAGGTLVGVRLTRLEFDEDDDLKLFAQDHPEILDRVFWTNGSIGGGTMFGLAFYTCLDPSKVPCLQPAQVV